MKKILLTICAIVTSLACSAQWTQTDRTLQQLGDGLKAVLGSVERQQAAKLQAQQKAQYQEAFNDAYETAKILEENGEYADALSKYEDAAKLNCDYGYTDQRKLSSKITSLYKVVGKTEEGPSILNNDKVTLSDYSAYRFVRENPICQAKKMRTDTRVLRVCLSDKETRIEFECENPYCPGAVSAHPKTYIKGNKGGKLGIVGTDNVELAPGKVIVPSPYQKLRYALIFPPLPAEATSFEVADGRGYWKFTDIKTR